MNDLNKALDGIEILLLNSSRVKLTDDERYCLLGLQCKIWDAIEREAGEKQ